MKKLSEAYSMNILQGCSSCKTSIFTLTRSRSLPPINKTNNLIDTKLPVYTSFGCLSGTSTRWNSWTTRTCDNPLYFWCLFMFNQTYIHEVEPWWRFLYEFYIKSMLSECFFSNCRSRGQNHGNPLRSHHNIV